MSGAGRVLAAFGPDEPALTATQLSVRAGLHAARPIRPGHDAPHAVLSRMVGQRALHALRLQWHDAEALAEKILSGPPEFYAFPGQAPGSFGGTGSARCCTTSRQTWLRGACRSTRRFAWSHRQTFFRTATADVRVGDHAVPDRRKILLFLGAANPDPRR